MIDIMQDIYATLAGDLELQNRLATDPETGAIAIYTETAQDKNGPYLLLTFGPASEEFDTQVTTLLQVDVLDRRSESRQSVLPVMHIRDRVIRVLDRHRTLFGTRNLRLFYTADRALNDDNGRYRRWAIDFNVRYNRDIS